MKQNKFELEVKNTINNLPVISDFVADVLTHFEADHATVNRVQLAVDEACTNIIKYAYSGEGVGRLKLVLELEGNELIITVTDWGKPFDPNTIPPPDLNSEVEERQIGGLGIYFIKKLMDDVSYSFDTEKGNRLILKRKLLKANNNP
jgi:anti-sigma regulatory factor (Ser/Thr protein kinase)